MTVVLIFTGLSVAAVAFMLTFLKAMVSELRPRQLHAVKSLILKARPGTDIQLRQKNQPCDKAA